MTTDPKIARVENANDHRPKPAARGTSLGEEFDPRSNALNAWRLTLAMGVILWHSWPVAGRQVSFAPAHQLLRDAWVDGFFAVSGFLITWSWFRHPRVRDYFLARGLRILPGLWICLIITAVVMAPISVAIQGGSAVKLLFSRATVEYVFENSAILLLKQDIGGTPSGVPVPGIWDGPVWTLSWEVLCYIAIAGLGLAGLLRRRWFIPTALAMAVLWSLLLPPWGVFADVIEAQRRIEDPATAALLVQAIAARFLVMFLAGALLYKFRNAIPARWSLVALSVVIVLAASFLPNYRMVAAVPLAYAIIVSGALIHNKRLRLRTDLSYGVYIYAWPVQQFLVICGLRILNPFVFALVSAAGTLPLAALSWFLVEKPAIALKSRLMRRSIGSAGNRQPG
ncbi:acyltransferase [Mycobacterium cookii]|uniref:Acyltransferase n=1 Tax=Mycobacterium cookii TaxID=1775 RepID=A0A7I7KZ21_9MYCO|nr:acyltransferase [Mycobacterium cookii]MCV7331665.1 acyltransferase [Mycobacterium cookii]BBX46959.1 acyltransferase [Mycobacterium cookii]